MNIDAPASPVGRQVRVGRHGHSATQETQETGVPGSSAGHDSRTSLSEAELAVTAYMARLRLSGAERERLRAGVQQILSYFDVMAAADVSDVEPTTHALGAGNRLRPDEVVASERRWPAASPERLLATAAECEDDHFSVPNVL